MGAQTIRISTIHLLEGLGIQSNTNLPAENTVTTGCVVRPQTMSKKEVSMDDDESRRT